MSNETNQNQNASALELICVFIVLICVMYGYYMWNNKTKGHSTTINSRDNLNIVVQNTDNGIVVSTPNGYVRVDTSEIRIKKIGNIRIVIE